MGRFAMRNLRTRPLRTALALIGLSVPILGVLGLFSVSQGLRNMVGDTLSQVEGVMILRENTPSPVFSKLPADLGPKIRAIAGVRAVRRALGNCPSRGGPGVCPGVPDGKVGHDVDPGPAGDPGARHRSPQGTQERRVPQGQEGRAFPRAPGSRAAQHRHQPEDRPRPSQGRRQAAAESATRSNIGGTPFDDHRDLRDRLDAPGRR